MRRWLNDTFKIGGFFLELRKLALQTAHQVARLDLALFRVKSLKYALDQQTLMTFPPFCIQNRWMIRKWSDTLGESCWFRPELEEEEDLAQHSWL